MSSSRHAVMAVLSFTGLGNFPSLANRQTELGDRGSLPGSFGRVASCLIRMYFWIILDSSSPALCGMASDDVCIELNKEIQYNFLCII